MKHRINITVFLLFIILILILNWSLWFILLPFFIFSLVLIYGVFEIRFNYFLKSIHKNNHILEKSVAITLDDGPTEYTSKFLEILHEHNAKATFFCIGKQIEKHPQTFLDIIKYKHEIGNHTYHHSNKTGFLNSKEMISEIEKCDVEIEKIAGFKTHLYRPPFGITNPNIAIAIGKTKKKSIGWSIRSFDTIIDDPDKIYTKIIKQLQPGSVILLHDTSEKSLKVLQKLLLFLKQNNYSTKTISQLLNL